MNEKYVHNKFVFGTRKRKLFKKGTFAKKLFIKLSELKLDPLIACCQILQYEPENRKNEDLEKTFPWIMSLNDLYEFLIKKENFDNYKNILLEFTFVLFYQCAKHNKIIKRVGEKLDFYILIMSGIVEAYELLFKKYNLTEEQFLIHVLKLKLIHEYEMVKKCINSNSDIININEDIEDYLKHSNKYDYNTILNKAKKNLNFCGIHNFQKTEKEIKDSSSYLKSTSYVTSYLLEDSDSKVYNSMRKDELKKFYLLPYYSLVGTYSSGASFGNLLLNKLSTSDDYTLISKDLSDIGYIDKKKYTKGNIFKIIENKMKKILNEIEKKYFIFQNVAPSSFINNNFTSLFVYKKYKKGEFLFRQDAISKGIFFVENGNFDIYCNHKFDELDNLSLLLGFSLDKFNEYIPSIKKSENRVQNLLQMFNNPLYKTDEFKKIAKETKKIIVDYSKNGDTLGLYECFDYKSNIYHFSAECVSDSAVVYYLSREAFSYLCDKEKSIIQKIIKIVEFKANFYIASIHKYKNNIIQKIKNDQLRKNNLHHHVHTTISNNDTIKFPDINVTKSNNYYQTLTNTSLCSYMNNTSASSANHSKQKGLLNCIDNYQNTHFSVSDNFYYPNQSDNHKNKRYGFNTNKFFGPNA